MARPRNDPAGLERNDLRGDPYIHSREDQRDIGIAPGSVGSLEKRLSAAKDHMGQTRADAREHHDKNNGTQESFEGFRNNEETRDTSLSRDSHIRCPPSGVEPF